jgi:hypothetical protein
MQRAPLRRGGRTAAAALASLLRDIGASISDAERDAMVLTALTVYARGESKDLRAVGLCKFANAADP